MNNGKFRLSEYDSTIREVLDSGGQFRIYPSGTSMLPLIRQGVDSIALKKPEGHLKARDIAFYTRENGDYILHRVIKAKNGVYTLCGDNQLTLENGVPHSSVIGVVTEIYRGDKKINTVGLPYRTYLLLWRSFFIRRVFFKLRSLLSKGKRNENKAN